MGYDQFNEALAFKRGTFLVAPDGDYGLEIMYVGDEDSATVTVASDGNITFKHGDAAAEANDTSIGGAADSGATLDVSETTEDTFGECVDLINGSPNWKARIVDALRADSATDTLLAMAEYTLTPGVAKLLAKDTSTAFNLAKAFTLQTLNEEYAKDVHDDSTVAKVYGMSAVTTYGSGTSSFQIYYVVTDRYGVHVSETKIFEEAGGATTVAAEATIPEGGIKPGARDVGYKLLARISNSAALSGATDKFIVDGAAISALAREGLGVAS